MARSRSIPTTLIAISALAVPGLQQSAARADPGGTVKLTVANTASTISLIDGTEAGIVYSTGGQLPSRRQHWLKEPGRDPVRLAWAPTRMKGRMLFGWLDGTMRYAVLDGPIQQCSGVAQFVALTPAGWAELDSQTAGPRSVTLTTATASGCTTRTFLAASESRTAVAVSEGGPDGLAIITRDPSGQQLRLGHHPYDDPAHPVELESPPYPSAALGIIEAGAVLYRSSNYPFGEETTRRVPIDGSPGTDLPADLAPYLDGTPRLTASVTAALPCKASCGRQVPIHDFATVPVTGGPVERQSGMHGGLASDGTRFYTSNAPDEAPGIYARSMANGPATLVVAAPDTRWDPISRGIALSPGRVYYASCLVGSPCPKPGDWPSNTYDVATRPFGRTPGQVQLGAELKVRTVPYPSMYASAGRLLYSCGMHRTYTGMEKQLPWPACDPGEVSGNRMLVKDRYGVIPDNWIWKDMFDVRTGKLVYPDPDGTADADDWPQGPQALFGNYVAYAGTDRTAPRPPGETANDGSVRVKDLSNGKVGVHKASGPSIAVVAIHGRWLAWVTACSRYPCSQTLTIRDTATGRVTTLGTRGTTSVALSGGYLALDVVPGSQRLLRTVRLSTGSVGTVGSLPADNSEGYAWDPVPMGPPRHFALDDETIAWIDRDNVAKVAPLAPFVEAPIYLGNVIAPGSFSPNGDGVGDVWAMAFPVSKALPSCTVTVYRGSVPVRVLNCANTTGMATAVWDGRTGSGARLPTGRYTYRVNGRDGDGWLRSSDLRLVPITGAIYKAA